MPKDHYAGMKAKQAAARTLRAVPNETSLERWRRNLERQGEATQKREGKKEKKAKRVANVDPLAASVHAEIKDLIHRDRKRYGQGSGSAEFSLMCRIGAWMGNGASADKQAEILARCEAFRKPPAVEADQEQERHRPAGDVADRRRYARADRSANNPDRSANGHRRTD